MKLIIAVLVLSRAADNLSGLSTTHYQLHSAFYLPAILFKTFSAFLFPQDVQLLYFGTSSPIHAERVPGRHSEGRKGGDLRDDLLMIVDRTFVQMHAQYKSSLEPELQRCVSDKRGKFTRAKKNPNLALAVLLWCSPLS